MESKNLLIVVSGAPASGKTSLSKELSKRFNLPVINKDEIKELLFDSLGFESKEWSIKLGNVSFGLTDLFVEKMIQTGASFIVEANFDNRYAEDFFSRIQLESGYRLLQLHCVAPYEILFERFVYRDNNEIRHPGHKVNSGDFENYKKMNENRVHRLNITDTIDIDTSDFKTVDFDEIYNDVAKRLYA